MSSSPLFSSSFLNAPIVHFSIYLSSSTLSFWRFLFGWRPSERIVSAIWAHFCLIASLYAGFVLPRKGRLLGQTGGFLVDKKEPKKRLEFQGHRLRDPNAPQRSLFGSFKASRMLDRLVFGNTIRTRLEIGFPFSWRQRGYRPGRINQHVGRKKKIAFPPVKQSDVITSNKMKLFSFSKNVDEQGDVV